MMLGRITSIARVLRMTLRARTVVLEAGPATTIMIRHGRMKVAIAAAVTVIEGSARAIASRSERAIGVVMSAQM